MKQARLCGMLCLGLAIIMAGLTPASGQEAGEVALENRAPDTTPARIAAPGGVVRWPMRLAAGRPVALIEAKLNGEGPFLFYLDTGAATATLDTAFVERLGLNKVAETGVRGPGGNDIEADVVQIESMEIGDILFEQFEAVAFDRSQFAGGEDLAGSIGLPLFGDLPLTIDYQNDRIEIGGESLPEPDGIDVLNCDFSGRLPLFPIRLGDEEVQTAFDTGLSGFLVVSDGIGEKLEFLTEPVVMGRGRTISGEFDIRGAKLDGNLVVGQHVTTMPMVILMPTEDLCALGYPWIQDKTVTYDRSQGRIRFAISEQESEATRDK